MSNRAHLSQRAYFFGHRGLPRLSQLMPQHRLDPLWRWYDAVAGQTVLGLDPLLAAITFIESHGARVSSCFSMNASWNLFASQLSMMVFQAFATSVASCVLRRSSSRIIRSCQVSLISALNALTLSLTSLPLTAAARSLRHSAPSGLGTRSPATTLPPFLGI